jgi:hypothetical protein
VQSTSSTGVSVISVELKEAIREVDPVWANVRSKVDDAIPELPPEATDPEYQDSSTKASALIVGLTWPLDSAPNYTILGRLAETLEEQPAGHSRHRQGGYFWRTRRRNSGRYYRQRAVSPGVNGPGALPASCRQRCQGVGRAVPQRGSGIFAGSGQRPGFPGTHSRHPDSGGERGPGGKIGRPGHGYQSIQDPATDLAFVNGQPAVVLSATVESDQRVDQWAVQARQVD